MLHKYYIHEHFSSIKINPYNSPLNHYQLLQKNVKLESQLVWTLFRVFTAAWL